jgi:hypothetical protein
METLVRALRGFYFCCVAPHWPHIVAAFRADVAARDAWPAHPAGRRFASGLNARWGCR